MEVRVLFQSWCKGVIKDAQMNSIGVFETNPFGVLTWDCPYPGKYHFISTSNRSLSVVGHYFSWVSDTLTAGGVPGSIDIPSGISTPMNYLIL